MPKKCYFKYIADLKYFEIAGRRLLSAPADFSLQSEVFFDKVHTSGASSCYVSMGLKFCTKHILTPVLPSKIICFLVIEKWILKKLKKTTYLYALCIGPAVLLSQVYTNGANSFDLSPNFFEFMHI